MTTLQTSAVPLGSLVLSQHNVRNVEHTEDDVADLFASIESVGLIHPLVVHEIDGGNYGVIAGGRRLAAMRYLMQSDNDNWTADTLIPVSLAPEDAEAQTLISLAENFVNRPMTDIQVYDAVAARGVDAHTTEEWAQAFGVGIGRMRRILRLAALHPDILAAYRDRKLSERALKDLGSIPDPNEQKQMFDKLQAREISEWQIKPSAGFGNQDHERLLAFVGQDEYVAQGGVIEEDIFDEGRVRIGNGELLASLAEAKLDQIKAAYAQEHGVEFWDEPPGKNDSYRYAAKATRPDSVQETLREQLGIARGIENQLFDEGYLDEDFSDMEDWLPFRIDDDVTIASEEDRLSVAAALQPGKIKEGKKLLAKLWKALDDFAKTKADNPPAYPEGATIAVARFTYSGDFVIDRYFPKIEGENAPKPKAEAPKPGDEDFDPDSPTLTQRATQVVTAIRAKALHRHLDDSPAACAMAHTALIFYLAWTTYRHMSDDMGLVTYAGGSTYNYEGTAAAGYPRPDLPGFDCDRWQDGWEVFREEATQAQIERAAAYVLASRIKPTPGEAFNSMLTDVFRGLQDHSEARRCTQPDMDTDFFKLFPKKVLAEFAGTIAPSHKEAVLARKKDGPAEYMVQLHHAAEPLSPSSDWLPDFLSFQVAP